VATGCVPGKLVRAIVYPLLTAGIIGIGPADWWLCDLFANLRLHVMAGLLLTIPVIATGPQRFLLAACLIAFCWGTFSMLRQSNGASFAEFEGHPVLSIMSFNLGRRPDIGDVFIAHLDATSPDLLVLQEFGRQSADLLAALEARYPYSVLEERDDSFGIAMYSRHPLVDAEVLHFASSGIPFLRASVRSDGETLDVLGIHLQWPMTPSSFRERNRQIDVLEKLIMNRSRPAVLCGDWNLTPWSGHYHEVTSGDLSDSGRADRFRPTWPTYLLLPGIAVDHCFVTYPLVVADKSIGPPSGSDHRPITTQISTLSETLGER